MKSRHVDVYICVYHEFPAYPITSHSYVQNMNSFLLYTLTSRAVLWFAGVCLLLKSGHIIAIKYKCFIDHLGKWWTLLHLKHILVYLGLCKEDLRHVKPLVFLSQGRVRALKGNSYLPSFTYMSAHVRQMIFCSQGTDTDIRALSTECTDTFNLMTSTETKLKKFQVPSYGKHFDDGTL